MYINAKNLVYTIQDQPIIRDVSVTILKGDRIALIGNNGAGKSTLIRILNGEIIPTSGKLDRKARIYYLPQIDFTLQNSTETVYEYISRQVEEWWEILVILENEFRLKELDSTKQLRQLSGGELMKLNLAIAKYFNPEILMLDEPTNHLDLPSRKALEVFLNSFENSFILASHDVSFIDEVANNVWELEEGKIQAFGGNYSKYLEQKEVMRQAQEKQYEASKKKLGRLELSLKREDNRADNSRRKGEEMKKDRSMARIQIGYFKNRAVVSAGRHSEKLITQISEAREDVDKLKEKKIKHAYMDLQTSEGMRQNRLVAIDNGQVKIEDHVVLNEVDFDLYYGNRVVLMGANGSGKTSFIKALMEKPPYKLDGERVEIKRDSIVYVSQNYDIVDPEKTLLDNIYAINPRIKYENARKVLGNFLFLTDFDVKKRAKVLSGGETVRLVLAMLTCTQIDLLILDEPTNNLDINTINIMVEALSDFPGAILVISHNIDFLARIEVNQAYFIKNQKINKLLSTPADANFYNELLEIWE